MGETEEQFRIGGGGGGGGRGGDDDSEVEEGESWVIRISRVGGS